MHFALYASQNSRSSISDGSGVLPASLNAAFTVRHYSLAAPAAANQILSTLGRLNPTRKRAGLAEEVSVNRPTA
jgi:hypothetical protein